MVPARRSILLKSSHEIIRFFVSLLNNPKVITLFHNQMQVKIKFLLLVLLAMPMLVSRVFAQEGNQNNSETQEISNRADLNLNDDKTLIMDSDARPPKIQATTKDNSTPASAAQKKQEQNKVIASPDKTEEDLLNFN